MLSLTLAFLLLAPAAEGRRFEVTASKFKFEPARIEVHEGDHVVLDVRSADTEHGIAIKKLSVKAAIPKGGEPVRVEFDATRPGIYEITCSEYCGKGHSRMKATLVVTPRAVAGGAK